jgi:folate-binding protein YgfZ
VSALDDALTGAALVDLSSWARLRATGPAFLGLLHRLSTAEVENLAPGEGRPTVVTTPKGRVLARLIVLHLGEEGILALSGPGTAESLRKHLTKYALGEDIGLSDVTSSTNAYAIVGPRWADAAQAMGVGGLAPYATATTTDGARVARTNGFDDEGLLVLSTSLSAALPSLSPEEFEAWRVLTGRPLAGHELTEEYNPLEAGLKDAVSFTKGCYTGQEVVARLNTYDKVAREIVRLEIPGGGLPPPRARLCIGEREVGTLTSAARDPRGETVAALAYVKKRDVPKGAEVVDVVWDGGKAEARIVSR